MQRYAASSGHFRQVMLRKVKKSCHAHADQDYEACAVLVDALVDKFKASRLLMMICMYAAWWDHSAAAGLASKPS
ncbi:MAG: hypothetical protein LRZ85_04760 [Alphaproteobacteria bacterium]|nr:hypothetical protein [Alphaproteobacteria bacterium]